MRFPRMNCFTFVNKLVGEIMAISFIPKKGFNPLKALLRRFYFEVKENSPKYRGKGYFTRCFYRKSNRITVFFKRY
jgi:hypothetical protein